MKFFKSVIALVKSLTENNLQKNEVKKVNSLKNATIFAGSAIAEQVYF